MTGTDLKTLRESRGLSQMDLATLLKVWPTTIAKWEAQGEEPLKFIVEQAIKAVLKVEV